MGKVATALALVLVVVLTLAAAGARASEVLNRLHEEDAAHVGMSMCTPGTKLPMTYALEKPVIENGISRIKMPTSATWFFVEHVVNSRPAIMKGLVDTWPAGKDWKSDEYLRHTAGHEEVNVEVAKGNHFGYEVSDDKDWKTGTTTLDKFLQVYRNPKRQKNYYVSNDIVESLEDDISIPSWIPCSKDPKYFHDTAFWFGAGGQVSLLHSDPEDNILNMIDGRKLVYLFPPSQSKYLYEKLPGERQGLPTLKEYEEDKADALGLDSTKHVHKHDEEGPPSRVSPVDISEPDYDKFPLLRHAQGYAVILEPGDTLYLPKFWWHQVHSFCRNIAVNHWFDIHDLHGRARREPSLYVAPSDEVVKRLTARNPKCYELLDNMEHRQRTVNWHAVNALRGF